MFATSTAPGRSVNAVVSDAFPEEAPPELCGQVVACQNELRSVDGLIDEARGHVGSSGPSLEQSVWLRQVLEKRRALSLQERYLKTMLSNYWRRKPRNEEGPGVETDKTAMRAVRTFNTKDQFERRLRTLQRRHPMLSCPSHQTLASLVQALEASIARHDVCGADGWLLRIEREVEVEENTMSAAFMLFVVPGEDQLSLSNVAIMLSYFGCSSNDKSVEAVLKLAGEEEANALSFHGFQRYVSRMGGCHALFASRRTQPAECSTPGPAGLRGASMDPAVFTGQLKLAGFDAQDIACCQLVLPRAVWELQEVARLQPCQRLALRQIRTLAKANHACMLPVLLRKAERLGFSAADVWMTLAHIRELAPIILHVDLTSMARFICRDTHYRSQFETSTSNGLLKHATRMRWESRLFGGAYDDASAHARPKYGVLNVMNDYRGVVTCARYGDSYLVLQDSRMRATFTPEDSAKIAADRVAVVDYYAHVLVEYSEEELSETIRVARTGQPQLMGDSGKLRRSMYKEAQIHGELSFDRHVERLVAAVRHRRPGAEDKFKALCALHGWQFSWMDEELKSWVRGREGVVNLVGERAATRRESIRRSIHMQDVPTNATSVFVDGFCRVGCGRPVAPGSMPGGGPYTTCCRGCPLGFGHDLWCNEATGLKPPCCGGFNSVDCLSSKNPSCLPSLACDL